MVGIVLLTICQIVLAICLIYGRICQKFWLFISGTDCQARLVLEIIGIFASAAMSGLGTVCLGRPHQRPIQKVGNVYGL